MGLPVASSKTASEAKRSTHDAQESAATSARRDDDHHTTAMPKGAGVNTGAGTTRAKTAEEVEADRLYDERIEEEYAKRDGGS
ncbi:hypothetical protein RJ55_08529 [Drechmeria coniospora]|nr:hypothetical protein RJ55_08529 [Drechmeria coniospora]